MEPLLKFLLTLEPWTFVVSIIVVTIGIILVCTFGSLKVNVFNKVIQLGKKKHRSCTDCMMITDAERKKLMVIVDKLQRGIMKKQMDYAEDRLIDIKELLLGKVLVTHVARTFVFDVISCILMSLKDEIRRSIKNNGFFTCSESDFNDYIVNRNHIFNEIIRKNMNVHDVGFKDIAFNEIIRDIYSHAKTYKEEDEKEINSLEETYYKWIDDFVKTKV